MDDDREPPKLTIAASNDDVDMRKFHALDDLRWPTREMAANLLRVMRGHGRPSELPQQIINLSEAILAASKVSNAWGIWNEIEEVLHAAFPTYDELDWDDRPDITAARGSLQLLASRLMEQRAQEAAGSREIREAFAQFERKVERRRQEAAERWAAEQALRRAQRALKRKPRKKAAPKSSKPQVARKARPEREIEHTGSTAEFMKKRAAQLKGVEND